jgi:mannose/fructose/N-acetylgalactosamine-specific phosphotransferase system component IID
MAETNQKLSRQALKKAAFRHNWMLQWCWNYERMQAYGFAYSLVPVMKELYDTEEEVCENLERHMEFYNSHPGTSAIIFGASAALEEKYHKNISTSAKTALMGPLGSIGDTFQAALVQPFAFLISAALAVGAWPGNLFSIPMLFIPFLIYFGLRWPFFWWGYNQSTKIIENVNKQNKLTLLQNAAQIVGLTIMGGLIPGILGRLRLNITRIQKIHGTDAGEPFDFHTMLDSILPYFLPLGLVAFCYWMLKNRGLSPVKTVIITAVIAFVLGILKLLV